MPKKNYIAIVRDHSASMSSIRKGAARDYNDNVDALKSAALKEGIDTIVSTIKCGDAYAGYGKNLVSRDVVNSSVQALTEIKERDYSVAGGSTPLFDAVGEAVSVLESAPDRTADDVSFLVMVITDGEENSSQNWSGQTLSKKIQALQATDRWTFVFRVPRGSSRNLERLGIPAGNILEWDQTDKGFEVATRTTRSAIDSYYTRRTAGETSVQTFYSDLQGVKAADLKAVMTDIKGDVQIFKNGPDVKQIRELCENRTKKPFLKGAAFYELLKPEKEVQDYKKIVIRDRESGAVYAGSAARQVLGLPTYGTVKLVPGDHSKFDVFVQSTSTNRKIPAHTRVLYYPNVGVPYTEGPSAR